MSKWKHRLSNKNTELRTATCGNCGVVDIVLKGKVWRCRIAINALKRNYGGRTRPNHCEVCGSNKRICYDHSHQSGEFRGWLCNACNVALGCVEDNPETLKKLANYLEQ